MDVFLTELIIILFLIIDFPPLLYKRRLSAYFLILLLSRSISKIFGDSILFISVLPFILKNLSPEVFFSLMKEGFINPPFSQESVSIFNEYRFGFFIGDWFCGLSKKSNKYREFSFIVNTGFVIPSGATPFV